jgi:hypothetical protein
METMSIHHMDPSFLIVICPMELFRVHLLMVIISPPLEILEILFCHAAILVVPVNVHIAKGWGYAVDPETTPTTGELVVFQNKGMADAVFAGRNADIASFNAKIAEYDAEVFSGGALLRWLRPDGNGGDYEPRKLVGQSCGSPEYGTNPGAECILGNCNTNLFKKVCV